MLSLKYLTNDVNSNIRIPVLYGTVLLDLNFTYARAQKATASNIHGNALE